MREGNDWILESLASFDTEESLTITMKNGDVVTVKVTDAQPSEGNLGAIGNDDDVVVSVNKACGEDPTGDAVTGKSPGEGYVQAETRNDVWNLDR